MKHLFFFCLMILKGTTVLYAAPLVWYVPPQNTYFVGRNETIGRITQQFNKGAPLVVLTGSPGVGKSQIAKQYLYCVGQNYQIVWWFHANKTLPQQFESLSLELNKFLKSADQINPKKLSRDQLIEVVKEVLRQQNLNCLFVFDSVEDFQKMNDYLPFSSQGRTHILVTSCKRVTAYPSLVVRPFSSQEAMAFLQKVLPEESEEKHMQLTRYFSGYPLTLAAAASLIASYPSVSISTYLSAYTIEKQAALTETPNLFVDQHEHDIYAILRLILRSLKERSPEAFQLIQFFSCLSPQQIPFSYVESWLKYSGVQQSADKMIGILFDHSLVDVEKDNTQEKVRLTMHDLIHKIIHAQLSESEKRELLPQAIQVISEPFRLRSDLMTRAILREPEHLQHAEKILTEAKKLGYHSGPLLSLRIRVLHCLIGGFRDFDKAQELVKDIENDQKTLHPGPYPDPNLPFAISQEPLDLIDQSLLESSLGCLEAVLTVNYDKAIEHENRALQLIEGLPAEYEQKIRIITNLIQDYVLQGKLSLAEPLLEKGKAFLSCSESDSYNAFFLYGWVFFLVENGQLEEALQALGSHEAVASKIQDHPTMLAYVLIWKARALLEASKKEKCNRVLDDTAQRLEGFFGTKDSPLKEDVKVLQILNNLDQDSASLQEVTTLQEALQVYNKAWKGEKKHRTQAFAYFVLGQIYEKLGDTQKAIVAYQESEKIWEAILKEKKILDVSRLYSAFSILGLKTQNVGLAREYMGKQIETFGLNHPGTLKITSYAMKHDLRIPYPGGL